MLGKRSARTGAVVEEGNPCDSLSPHPRERSDRNKPQLESLGSLTGVTGHPVIPVVRAGAFWHDSESQVLGQRAAAA